MIHGHGVWSSLHLHSLLWITWHSKVFSSTQATTTFPGSRRDAMTIRFPSHVLLISKVSYSHKNSTVGCHCNMVQYNFIWYTTLQWLVMNLARNYPHPPRPHHENKSTKTPEMSSLWVMGCEYLKEYGLLYNGTVLSTDVTYCWLDWGCLLGVHIHSPQFSIHFQSRSHHRTWERPGHQYIRV